MWQLDFSHADELRVRTIIIIYFEQEPLRALEKVVKAEVFDPFWIQIVVDSFCSSIQDVSAILGVFDFQLAEWITLSNQIKIG